MLTPQEVASHSFARASFGGYNMSMVDEFLDTLTEDYTTLYNDNAILKNKLKVLSDTIEEYRATDDAMRKTLLAAQKMADNMVAEAQEKRDRLVADAEQSAAQRVEELKQQVAAEEYRVEQAKQATAEYVRQLNEMHQKEGEFLAGLDKMMPPAPEFPKDDPSADIKASVSALYEDDAAGGPADPARASEEDYVPTRLTPPKVTEIPDYDDSDAPVLDDEATRRFEDLKFGKDYSIE